MRRILLSIIGCFALVVLGPGAARLPAGAAPAGHGEVNPPACADPHGWQFKAGQGNPYRLWFPDHNQKAAELATFLRHQMDEKIWPKETNLMNTTPVANTQDICLVDTLPKAKGIGHTTSAGVGCGHKSATVEMLNTLGDKDAEDVLAHEFFHVLQFALDVKCSDTIWWRESTALWAEDFVYPDDNREQQFADNYLQDMDKPLNDNCDCQEEREYGSYLFPFFIAHTFSPDLVAQIWHKAQDDDNILDAIDDVLPGGLDKQWPEFALDAWNAKPRDEFRSWDGLDAGASKEYGDPIKLKAGDDDGLSTGDLKHMSVKYFSFDVEAGVRTVSLQNGYPYFQLGGKNKHAGVHAIVELDDGSLEVRDWSNQIGPSYCLDLSGQHVKKLTIVYTNAGKTEDFDSSEPSYLVASNVGCKSWTVSVSAEVKTDTGADVQTTGTATYKRVPSSPTDPVLYVPVSGTVNWTGTYSADDGCSGTGNGSWAVTKDAGYMTMYWNLHNLPNILPTRGYAGDLGGPLFYEWQYTCPGDPNPHPVDAGVGAWNTGNPTPLIKSGGLSGSGHYSVSNEDGTQTWHWTMTSSG